MNYNIKDIELFFKNLSWDYFYGFSEEKIDDFLTNINYEDIPNYDYEIGATKLVLIPEDFDYVIKIPYNELSLNGDVFDFSGLPEGMDNYCEYELNLYHMAEEKGWKDFFLPLEYVGSFNNFPIYIQSKAEEYEKNFYDYATEASKQAIINKRKEDRGFLDFLSLPFDWVACCLDMLHSIETLRQFFYFLKNEKISSDLHRQNIGFYHNKPVIIDYGGYFEDY